MSQIKPNKANEAKPNQIKPKPSRASQGSQEATAHAEPPGCWIQMRRSDTEPATPSVGIKGKPPREGPSKNKSSHKTIASRQISRKSSELGSSLATQIGFRVRAIEHLHQDDLGKHRELGGKALKLGILLPIKIPVES